MISIIYKALLCCHFDIVWMLDYNNLNSDLNTNTVLTLVDSAVTLDSGD